jgi:hypothetical protein
MWKIHQKYCAPSPALDKLNVQDRPSVWLKLSKHMFFSESAIEKILSSQAERSQFSQLIRLLGMKLLVQYPGI